MLIILCTFIPKLRRVSLQWIIQFQDYDDWEEKEIDIKTEIPSIKQKSLYSEVELRTLTEEFIDKEYPINTWTHVYTDGSAEKAIKNGGAGIYIRYQNGQKESQSVATGKKSTNFRAETCALLHAAKTLNSSSNLSNNTVILTDCKSVLESILTGGKNDDTLRELQKELTNLKEKTALVLQWLPAHCGISGNEKADALSKRGSQLEQIEHKMNYREAKTIIKANMKEKWKEKHQIQGCDEIEKLNRNEQVIIF